jgi:enoyl-[acyl-carrier protein] reductase I
MTAQQIMKGKRGLIMGVANDKSIAWGIAKMLADHGAELAFTFQGHGFGKRVGPLAESVGSKIVMDCDVTDEASMDAVFERLKQEWDTFDFLVHAIAFADKSELKGRFADTSRANFHQSLDISCFSFMDAARRSSDMMNEGGSMVTLTYAGSQRVTPNYNVMGVAKAAIEASVRYLASDFGRKGIRVNSISPGPMRTLAGSAIGGARFMYKWNESHTALHRNVSLEEVGGAALYLLSDLGGGTTGDNIRVDAGYHAFGTPFQEDMSSD